MNDGISRRAAVSGLVGAAALPRIQAAELAASTALAASNFFGTEEYGSELLAIAAGEAGTELGGLFSIDDGAGNLIYLARTKAGSIEIARAVTPMSLAARSAAANIGSDNGNVQAELDSKAPSATKSTAVGATLYPVDHRLGRDYPPHPFEFITNPATQAGIIAGTSTVDVSTELQNMLDGWNSNSGKAGVVDFPVGRYPLGQKLLWRNWISWRGGTGRGHQLFLLEDHTGPYAFQFDSDPDQIMNGPKFPSSQFQQRLIGFDVNCNSAAAVSSVIYAPSWNEKSGLVDCMMRKIPYKAVRAIEFHGGSTGFTLADNCEFFFDPTATIGIELIGKSRTDVLISNKPQIKFNNFSIVGGAAPASNATSGFIAVDADNVHVSLQGANHVEKAWLGIVLRNGATLDGNGWTGSDDRGRAKELLCRAANHNGYIDLSGVDPGSASGARVLLDLKTGIHATNAVMGRVQVPSPPGIAWAGGSFRVSGGSITGTPDLVRCASAIREATGYYKVIFANSMFDADSYTVRVLITSDSDCRGHVRDSERTGAHFFIRIYRISDSTLFDPDTVTFEVIRKPGL